jgi:DNA-binding PadR family transcriptional regulator
LTIGVTVSIVSADLNAEVPLSPKALLLLGLLRRGPMSGYDLNRVVRSHGPLYADLKKGNIYHLLDRLATRGHLRVTVEPGARGPRGERLLYELTPSGREALLNLVRRAITAFEPADTGLASAVVFLTELDQEEAAALLRTRRDVIRERRAQVAAELGVLTQPLSRLAGDHQLALIDAELAWVTEAIALVEGGGWRGRGADHAGRAAGEEAR